MCSHYFLDHPRKLNSCHFQNAHVGQDERLDARTINTCGISRNLHPETEKTAKLTFKIYISRISRIQHPKTETSARMYNI